MTATQNLKKLVFLLFALLAFEMVTGQAKNVNEYITQLNDKANRVNQMANAKQVIEAMNLLNETRRDFDTYLNYYFENEMRAAKAESSGFSPQLNIQFSSVLTASYWESRVEQAQRSINLAEEAFSERNHQRTLDAQDQVWSYLKTVYGVGKTIKDVYENVQTMELYDAVKSAKEGIDDFIENYTEIENARLQIINTELYETQVRGLIRRGKIMEERSWQFASFMRAYEQDVTDFYSLVQRFNQKVNQIQNEVVVDWSSPGYSWNKQTWLSKINGFAQDFKAGNLDYSALKQKIESVNEKAETEKNKVYQNIHNSGVNDAFERGNKLENEFNDFYNLSIDILDECYLFAQNRQEEQRANEPQISTTNTGNSSPADIYGIDKNKYLNRLRQAGTEFQNGEISQTEFVKTKWRNILHDYNSECQLFAGAFKTREKADDASVAWQNFSDEMLNVLHGYIDGEPAQIVKSTGDVGGEQQSGKSSGAAKASSVDLFAGAGKTSKTSEGNSGAAQTTSPRKANTTSSNTAANTSNIPEKVSSAVNKMPVTGASSKARIPVYKLMENDKLVFKQTGGSFFKFYVRWVGVSFGEVLFEETKQIVYSTAELMAKRPEKAMFLDFQVNQYSDVHCYMEAWVLPGGVPIPADWNITDNTNSSTAATNSNNFYDLIKKADEAFNRKYWNESNGARASSNPKQESLDFLRKCEPIIARESNFNTKFTMVKMLSGKYAEYAKRVFAYTAKADFLQLGGGLLSKYGSQVNSEKDSKLKSNAYKTVAEGWRSLAQAATWGEHQYNKMYCDKESKKYYDYALREDRNNTQLQKTVEKINAPQKSIPAKVAQTPAIPEEKWSVAENMRNVMAGTDIDEAILKEEQPNYLEVGILKLNVGSGDVWIMVSGTGEWQKITDNSVVVYPGDKIKTGENVQNVSFTYSHDNSYVAIKPGAVVTIYEEQLCIQKGDVYVNVSKRGDKFLVITPTAVTGPRGTEFTVNVSSSGETNVHLYDGAIELRNSLEISYLVPGETASINSEAAEITTRGFNIQQHKQKNWNQIEIKINQQQFSNPFANVSGGGKIVGGK
ncbi:FecR family protein [Maribellus maritimus]|uniref:FecR family protein n=1 Tax=Maribellus maritimus TaxID=2870838 RepID=UPI001EEC30DA|nr:FecR family protein [Maribellus maritimus]MCG6186215.1 FecR family protein [Maribellus maritimus]